ncbi:hypothetical protein Tco_1265238 [Tanacetum coccineum]
MFLICFETPTSCLLNLLQWHLKEKKRDSEALDKYDEGLKRRYSDNDENEEWDGSGPSNQEPEEYGYSKYCFLCSDATNVVHRLILRELEGTLEQLTRKLILPYEVQRVLERFFGNLPRICSIVVNDLKYLYWASDVVESRSTTSLRFVFRHQIVDVGRQEEEEVEDFDETKLEVNDEEQESESARGSRSSPYKEKEFDEGDTNLDVTSTRDE